MNQDSQIAGDEVFMRRALSLAEQGRGLVEPNPMVGCVLVRNGTVIGEGYHRQFGHAHAEVEALAEAQRRGADPRDATAYVTLEPCSHYGKTPPCCLALIDARVKRVVIGTGDPSPHVGGQGVAALRAAGIEVCVGVLEPEARHLLGPFLKRLQHGRPWVIAKWAMSLDGKMATRTGHSQWISGPPAREIVHRIRSNVDAVMVGIGTALADNPALTARLPDAGLPNRVATRVVIDRHLRLGLDSQLVLTAHQAPVLIVCAPEADEVKRRHLQSMGVEVWSPDVNSQVPATMDFDYARLVRDALVHLAGRGMTNVLVEGGSALLGNLFDQQLVDEVVVFVSPKIIGGTEAIGPVGGRGQSQVPVVKGLVRLTHRVVGDDVFIQGFLSDTKVTSEC